MRNVRWPGLILMCMCAVAWSEEPTMFTVAKGEETGLKKIVEDWAADELKAQGGKYLDHGWWLWGLTAIDYDNDGIPDLVPSHHGLSGGLLLKNTFRQSGKVAFVNVTREMGLEPRKMPTGIGRKTFALDMNGDGWLDLFGVRSPHLFNEGGKKFTESADKAGFNSVHPLAIEDFNGDGLPDLLEADALHVFEADKKAFHAAPYVHPYEARLPKEILEQLRERKKTIRFWTYYLKSDFDLNGDGINDVVVAGNASYNGKPVGYFLTAASDGTLTDRTAASGLPNDAMPILLADLNADGYVDMISARGGGGIFLNDGKGVFTLKPGPATDYLRKEGPYMQLAYAEDFDADCDLDLVLVNRRMKSTAVFEHTGQGQFKKVYEQSSWDSDPVAIGDFNGDGRPDVAIGGPENTITILLNASKAETFSNLFVRMDGPNALAVGARVEAYTTGTLGKAGALPFARFAVPTDGTPLHLGLGKETAFDLVVVFPGKEPKRVTFAKVAAQPSIKVTPDGKTEALKAADR